MSYLNKEHGLGYNEGDFVVVENVTPATSKEILDSHNFHLGEHINRKIDTAKVSRLAAAMKGGKWNDKNPHGRICELCPKHMALSLQHRLLAAIEADYTFSSLEFHVVGREHWTETTMDKQSKSEMVFIANVRSDREISQEGSKVLEKMVGQFKRMSRPSPFVNTSGIVMTKEEIQKASRDHCDLLNALGAQKEGSVAQKAAVGLMIIANKIDKKEGIELLSLDIFDDISNKKSLIAWWIVYSVFKVTGKPGNIPRVMKGDYYYGEQPVE